MLPTVVDAHLQVWDFDRAEYPLSSARDNIGTLRVVEARYASMLTGTAIHCG